MMNTIKKLICRLFYIGSFLLFCQLPLYVEQYLLRLEGHQTESFRQVEKFREVAKMSNKSLEDYIEKFSTQEDKDFQRQATLMEEAIERYDFLTRAKTSLQDAPSLLRPCLFFIYFDSEVALNAWTSFMPGFLFSADIIIWGLIGWLFAWIVVQLFKPKKGS